MAVERTDNARITSLKVQARVEKGPGFFVFGRAGKIAAVFCLLNFISLVMVFCASATDYPPMYHNHSEYRGPNGIYQTRNLISSGSSFELGQQSAFDHVSVDRRMFYQQYNPGSGQILDAFIPPQVTNERAWHGSRSLRIDNPSRDGIYVGFNRFRAPADGVYVFSAYFKAENTNHDPRKIIINMAVNDKDGNPVGQSDQFIWEFQEWTRKYIVTAQLAQGQFYWPYIRVGSYIGPTYLAQGTLYVDAVQVELAENQQNPAPTDYIYHTQKQDLLVYTGPSADPAEIKTGNLYYLGDNETKFAHIQIFENESLPVSGPPSLIKWNLYDIYGDSNDPATALASGEMSAWHAADNFQTQTLNLSEILSSAAPQKSKGLYKMVFDLWSPDQTERLDREFLVFATIEKSPYAAEDRPDSYFGGHVTMFTGGDVHGWSGSRSMRDYIETAQNLGMKSSRVFGLFSQQHSETDPYFDDYVNAMRDHHFTLLPVIGQKLDNSDADQEWQDFIASTVNHYGNKISTYEVLNEPNGVKPASWYYGYLSRARDAVQNNPDVKLAGPSSPEDYLAQVLDYDDGVHGKGYGLLDISAPHFYTVPQDGVNGIPEIYFYDYQWGGIEEYLQRRWKPTLDAAAPDGHDEKPIWTTEFGLNHSALYDDIPIFTIGWNGEGIQFRPHMSGSLALSRKIASDLIRNHIHQIAGGAKKLFYFSVNPTWISDSNHLGFFDFDNTPLVSATAYAQMTRYLEGAEFVRAVEEYELRQQAMPNSWKSRALIFKTPDLENPGSFLPLAVVYNWDQDNSGFLLKGVPLAPANIDIMDLEGNPVAVEGASSFDLPLDFAPKYIVGKAGMTIADFVVALDQYRPHRPFKPDVTVDNGSVKVSWPENMEKDISYNIYRKEANQSQDILVDNIEKTSGQLVIFYDVPPAGSFQYRVSAVENGSEWETEPSEYSSPVSLNLPPVLNSVGNKQTTDDTALVFDVTASDPDAGNIVTIAVQGAPDAAVLSPTVWDPEAGWKATFTWQGPVPGEYPNVTFTASDDHGGSASEAITISVSHANHPPVVSNIGDQVVNEGVISVLPFTVTDPDGDQIASVTIENNPGFLSIVEDAGNYNLAISPNYSQAGTYENIRIKATDINGSPAGYNDYFKVTVNNLSVPYFCDANGNPIGQYADYTVTEGQPITMDIYAKENDVPNVINIFFGIVRPASSLNLIVLSNTPGVNGQLAHMKLRFTPGRSTPDDTNFILQSTDQNRNFDYLGVRIHVNRQAQPKGQGGVKVIKINSRK